MSSQSCRASPGRSSAGRPIWIWRFVFVYVPSFSACAEAGSTTSANQAVSVRKMSCTTRCSSFASASRAWSWSGSDIAGFSPMMYMPVISPSWTASMISTTVRPRFGSKRLAPEVLVPAADVELLYGLVVREVHRNQPRVGSALHVVLAAQRMESRAGPADLAGDQRERDQAAAVVGAVSMLRNAHAPEDDRRFRRRVDARNVAQHGRFDSDDIGHRFGRKILDLGLERFEARDVSTNVLLVVQLLVDDRVEQRVEQRHVAAGFELAAHALHGASSPGRADR